MSAFTPLIKKTLLAAGALGMAASALAAGPKDGIYIFTAPAATADAQEFLTFHTNDAGAVVAGMYRSKLASAPNGAMGLTTYASVGGNFGNGLAAGAPAPSVQTHMFRWSWWDSLSGTITNNVATLEGTSGHVGCASKVTVYLDGAQPTMTMQSTMSALAQQLIVGGMQAAYPPINQNYVNAQLIHMNIALNQQVAECAKPAYNYTVNLTKWF